MTRKIYEKVDNKIECCSINEFNGEYGHTHAHTMVRSDQFVVVVVVFGWTFEFSVSLEIEATTNPLATCRFFSTICFPFYPIAAK